MDMLQRGIDTATIALWLGHSGTKATNAYIHANLKIKEAALALTAPPGATPGRYKPTDTLLAFLESL